MTPLLPRHRAYSGGDLTVKGTTVRPGATAPASDPDEYAPAPSTDPLLSRKGRRSSRASDEYTQRLASALPATQELDRLLREWARVRGMSVAPSQSGKSLSLSMEGVRNIARLSPGRNTVGISVRPFLQAGLHSEAESFHARIKAVFGITKAAPKNPRVPAERAVERWNLWLSSLADDYLEARRRVARATPDQGEDDDESE